MYPALSNLSILVIRASSSPFDDTSKDRFFAVIRYFEFTRIVDTVAFQRNYRNLLGLILPLFLLATYVVIDMINDISGRFGEHGARIHSHS